MKFTLPAVLELQTLPALAQSWPAVGTSVEIELHPKQWATPTGMVGLACLADRHKRLGGRIEVLSSDCEQVGYWERMGFFREISLPYSGPSFTAHPPERRFAEIRRIGDIDEVDALTKELVEVTSPQEASFKTFSHILSEAMNNVCQHSQAYGFSAAQYWRTGMVEFCIADSGRGLLAALTASHNPVDDADAVRLALKVGVTSNSPSFGQRHMRNRGVGLSCIERLVTANRGQFDLWSGRGRYASGEIPYATPYEWIGTLLRVVMRRDQVTADFQSVMKQLTEDLRLIEAERRKTTVHEK